MRVEFVAQFRGDVFFERGYKGFCVPHILLNRFAVIVIVGEGGMQ
jgi:hypothetical protein